MSLQRADDVCLHYVYGTENQQTSTHRENAKQKHLFDTCGREAHLGLEVMLLLASERAAKSLTTCRIDLEVMDDLLEINSTRKRGLAFVTKRTGASLQQTSFLL